MTDRAKRMAEQFNRRVKQILDQFKDNPEFISGYTPDEHDESDPYDPRPDFVKRDEVGWKRIGRL